MQQQQSLDYIKTKSRRGKETHKFRVRKDQILVIKKLEKGLPGKRSLV